MIDKKAPPIGASFGEAYCVGKTELEAVIDLVTPAEAFDLIYHNDEVNIYRIFTQTASEPLLVFNLTFVGELIDRDKYLITSGTIRTTEYVREQEYEKIGKRILYNAIKQQWSVRF